jgi:hypothetical protein
LVKFGDDADPGMVTLFSIMWSFTTSAINTLGIYYALDRLIIYPLTCDMSEADKTIINWHILCRVGLGTLIGGCSAWVLLDILLGMDRHLKYSAGMLVGVMMLSLILQFYSDNKRRQVTIIGSLAETNRFAPLSSSANTRGIMDSAEMWCADEVHSDTLLIV